jgi:hypothetical protein
MGRCKFVVGGYAAQAQGHAPTFPVSTAGWKQAMKKALQLKKQGEWMVDINLQCGSYPHGSIFLVTCKKDVCDTSISSIERRLSKGDHTVIAGLEQLGRRKGSKKRKKSREKRKKKSGPLTPQQKKFKSAASACSGKPGYRECVAEKLRK